MIRVTVVQLLTPLPLTSLAFNRSFDDARVDHYLNIYDRRGSNEGRSTHTLGAALVHSHPRFHRVERRELPELRGMDKLSPESHACSS